VERNPNEHKPSPNQLAGRLPGWLDPLIVVGRFDRGGLTSVYFDKWSSGDRGSSD